MADKVNISQVIVEASILFVSVFTTLSLLFGATSTNFKFVYFSLGYMLYYSLPFIFSCFFGILTMIINNVRLEKLLIPIQVAFFLSGLMTVIWLATSAVGSSMLPLDFINISPSIAIPAVEFVIFGVFAMALYTPTESEVGSPTKNQRLLKLVNELVKLRNWFIGKRGLKYLQRKKISKNTKFRLSMMAAIILIFTFIGGIVFMSMIGFMPDNSIVESGSASLQFSSPLNLTLCHISNVSLKMADQLSLKIVGENNSLLSYYFLDDTNYFIFSNPNATDLTPKFIHHVGRNLVFNTVINETGNYHLVLTGNTAEGNNASYSISVLKVNSSNQMYFLLLSTGCIAGFIIVSKSLTKRKRKQLSLSDFSNQKNF